MNIRSSDQAHPQAATVIRGARVLSLNGNCLSSDKTDIVVRAGRIEHIGHEAGLAVHGPVGRVIPAEGLLAMPGLINAHFHSPGNLMKGRLAGHPLEIFMLHEVPPLAESADGGRLVYLRTALGALEMVRRGITAVQDDAYHVPRASAESIDAIMRAYRDVGIRATVAIDQPTLVEFEKYPFLESLLPEQQRQAMRQAPRQSPEELLALYRHLIQTWHGSAQGRLRAAVSCSAPQRVDADYALALAELSKKHDLPYYVHLLETRLQRVLGDVKFGRSLVQQVHAQGWLDERVMAIHAIWVDEHDIELLAQSGCTVAHNPVCNLRLGSGVMPWRALHDAGIPVCLGTDEMNTDDSVNLWFVAKTSALIHSLSSPDDSHWAQPEEVLRALTYNGARAMRMTDELGVLKPGAWADIILLDLNSVAYWPLNHLPRQLVHCEDGQSLRMTMVQGEVVFDHGLITTVDEASLREELQAVMPQVQAQMDRAAQEATHLEPYYRQMLAQSLRHPVPMRRTLYEAP